MKYYKRLKNEQAHLEEANDCRSRNRGRALRSLIALLKGIMEIDEITDEWKEKEACKWDEYLTAFEGWVARMPRLGEWGLPIRPKTKE